MAFNEFVAVSRQAQTSLGSGQRFAQRNRDEELSLNSTKFCKKSHKITHLFLRINTLIFWMGLRNRSLIYNAATPQFHKVLRLSQLSNKLWHQFEQVANDAIV